MEKIASWVIREKSTKIVIFETFSAGIASKIDADRYEALPIHVYLIEVNQAIKTADGRA